MTEQEFKTLKIGDEIVCNANWTKGNYTKGKTYIVRILVDDCNNIGTTFDDRSSKTNGLSKKYFDIPSIQYMTEEEYNNLKPGDIVISNDNRILSKLTKNKKYEVVDIYIKNNTKYIRIKEDDEKTKNAILYSSRFYISSKQLIIEPTSNQDSWGICPECSKPGVFINLGYVCTNHGGF